MAMRWRVALVTCVVVASGCAARGCSSPIESLPEPSPMAATVANGAAVAVSPAGVASMLAGWRDAIILALDSPFMVSVAQTVGPAGLTICPGGCNLTLTLADAASPRGCVDPVSGLDASTFGDQVEIHFDVALAASSATLAGPTGYCLGLAGPRCTATVSSMSSGSCGLSLQASVALTADVATGRPLVHTTLLGADPEGSDMVIAGTNTCGDIWCGLADVDTVRSTLGAAIRAEIAARVGAAIDAATCHACGGDPDCPLGTTCSAGLCRLGADCAPDIGVEGRLDLRSALGQTSRAAPASMLDLADTPAFDDTLGTGIAIALDPRVTPALAAGAAYRDPCVPDAPALEPTPSAQAAPSVLGADLDPAGDPSDVGLAVSRAHLDRLGWAAWRSGALCMDASSLLDAERLALLLPSLEPAIDDPAEPVQLKLRPKEPPHFTLGANTSAVDPVTGAAATVDPLATVAWPNVTLEAVLDAGSVVMFEADLTVALGAAIATDSPARVLHHADDVALTDVAVIDSELATESDAVLGAAARPLYALALARLSEPLFSATNLPTLFGSDLDPNAPPSALAGGAHAALFARMVPPPPAGSHASTSISSATVEMPATLGLTASALAAGGSVPRVHLQLSGTAPGTGALEWSLRVDGGFWRPFTDAAAVTLDAASLAIQGSHLIEARAREIDHPESLDPVGDDITVVVDASPPQVTLTASGGSLIATASDAFSAASELRYAFRVDAEPFGAPGTDATIAEPADYATADVQVTDAAGNVGSAHYVRTATDAGTPDAGHEPDASAADAGGSDPGPGSGGSSAEDSGPGRADAGSPDASGAPVGARDAATGGARDAASTPTGMQDPGSADAAGSEDAGASSPDSDGGCGCRTAGTRAPGAAPAVLIGLCMALVLRRRRPAALRRAR